jgi:hypothetical protein
VVRPDLTFTTIAATLAALAACSSKQPPAQITKPTEIATSAPTVSATAAAPAVTPEPVAAAPSARAEAKDAGTKKAGAIGSTTGQMSCGAGSCSGAPKKK